MLSPTVGFALHSPMPLVSGGGGSGRPENRKCYVPPLASESLILDFPLKFSSKKKQNSKIKNWISKSLLIPVKDLAASPEYCTSKILEHNNNTPSQCEKADNKKDVVRNANINPSSKRWICTVIQHGRTPCNKHWSQTLEPVTLEQWNFGANIGTVELWSQQLFNKHWSQTRSPCLKNKSQHEKIFEALWTTLKKVETWKPEQWNSGTYCELCNSRCQATFADSHLQQVAVPRHWLSLKERCWLF